MFRMFFSDEIMESNLQSQAQLYKECMSQIESLPSDMPQRLELAGWPPGIENQMWGLKLSLTKSMSPAHSGWIYSRILGLLKTNKETRVGCMIGNRFERIQQFTLVNQVGKDVYWVAMGPEAKLALQRIVSAEESFNPEYFDEDGYSKFELDESGHPISASDRCH
jgi:hypothetical protein